MGAGKTTFLEGLKEKRDSNEDFLDLDQVIFETHRTHQANLAEFITEQGFETFRALEIKELKEIIAKASQNHLDLFISLGGGAVTKELLKLRDELESCFLVWLNTPFPTCLGRILGDPSRPLVAKGPKYLKELYEEREKFYQKADICLDASSQDMVWTAKTLKETLLS
jgi:shikimate kinase